LNKTIKKRRSNQGKSGKSKFFLPHISSPGNEVSLLDSSGI
jgi:hypothetical protein